MATSHCMAQDAMFCDACEKSPVQLHCNLCATHLCKSCVGDHILNNPNKEHHIVIFKQRSSKPVFPCCQTHEGQNCEMQCQPCAMPVCVKCVSSGSHKKHDLQDLMELCTAKRETIGKKTEDLETSICPKYVKSVSETESQVTKLPENHEKVVVSIDDQGAVWHRGIDVIVNRLKEEAEKMRSDNLEALQKNLQELNNLLSQIQQAISENKKLLQSNNVAKIMDHNVAEFNIPPVLENKVASFSAFPFNAEQVYKLFGFLELSTEQATICDKKSYSLENIVLDFSKILVIREIDTGYKNVRGVKCLNQENVFVVGDYPPRKGDYYSKYEIKQFDMHQMQKKSIQTNFFPTVLKITPEGAIFYAEIDNNMGINRFQIFVRNYENSEEEKIIKLHDDWFVDKVFSAASGDLLVSCVKRNTRTHEQTQCKIVRYRDYVETQVIQFDQDGNPWFSKDSYVYCIDGNRNADLCVSISVDETNQVMAFNKEGQLRFRYTGNLTANKYTSFCPLGIVTDSANHILVSDQNNHCIHIIDMSGNFIQYIDNCKLCYPMHLSIDENNYLYVTESTTSKVKMIKYLA